VVVVIAALLAVAVVVAVAAVVVVVVVLANAVNVAKSLFLLQWSLLQLFASQLQSLLLRQSLL